MNRRDFLRSGVLPPRELSLLLAWHFGEEGVRVHLDLDREIPRRAERRLQAAVARRREGWPMQYILGRAWFWSQPLVVGPGVLVPRPETELLVEEALRIAPQGGRVADIGTGSGAIAQALAVERPDLHITAVERSRRALRYARRNLPASVRLLEGDLLQPLTEMQDLIVSNPPYVAVDEYETLQPEVRREPRMALISGSDGLRTIRRLVREAPNHLMPEGWLLLEVGAGQSAKVAALLARQGYRDVAVQPDLAGIPRALRARRPC